MHFTEEVIDIIDRLIDNIKDQNTYDRYINKFGGLCPCIVKAVYKNQYLYVW